MSTFAISKLNDIERRAINRNHCMIRVYFEMINEIQDYLKAEVLDKKEEMIFMIRLSELNNEFAQNGFYKFI